MGHDHSHHHSHQQDVSNIKVAFFLNIGFTIVELIGGVMVNSVAILSDAIHDLGDSLSLGFAWYFQKLSKKGRDSTFSYGYKRFALLGAIINSIVLVAGSSIILFETIPRLWNPEMPDVQGMLILAILGVVVNGAAVIRVRSGKSLSEQVVSLHLLEDVFGWVAVLVVSVFMMFVHLPVLDPILSILIAVFVLYNVYKSLKSAFKIILQASPSRVDHNSIVAEIKKLDKVYDVHDFHTWSMDGEYHVATIHIVMEENTSLEDQCEIKKLAKASIKEQSIDHVTIEIDQKEEICELEDC